MKKRRVTRGQVEERKWEREREREERGKEAER